MSEIEKALGGKIKPETDNLVLTDAAVPISLEATPQQFIDAVQDDIGFKDLYKLKQQLANTIGAMEPSPLRQKLIELRDHITSTAEDGQMAYVICRRWRGSRVSSERPIVYLLKHKVSLWAHRQPDSYLI